MAGGTAGPEMDLISESVENASARIRFFRLAYGAAGSQPIGRGEVVAILNDITRGGRLSIAYGPLDAQPRTFVQMVFLALQCMETAMPYGGRIEVSCDNGQWTISGHSEKFSFDSNLWDTLHTGEATDLAPAQVQFALLHVHSTEAGRRLRVQHTPDENLTVRF